MNNFFLPSAICLGEQAVSGLAAEQSLLVLGDERSSFERFSKNRVLIEED